MISYCPGSKNLKADAPLRLHAPTVTDKNPGPIVPLSITVAPITWDFDKMITQEVHGKPVPTGCPARKVYISDNHRVCVIKWAHTFLASGQPGILCTLSMIACKYWWPQMALMVTDSCPVVLCVRHDEKLQAKTGQKINAPTNTKTGRGLTL